MCAVCATIAGVFAIGANTAKAEVLTGLSLGEAYLYNNGKNESIYNISAYVPNTALDLLLKSAEVTEREFYVPENMFFEYEPDIEEITNKKRTAYALVLRCEDSMSRYNDTSYDSYKNRISDEYVFFVGNTKADFIDGVNATTSGAYNGNVPNSWNIKAPCPNGNGNKYYWLDLVEITYREYVVFTCEDNVYWRYDSEATRVDGKIIYSSENYLNFSNKSKAIEKLQTVTDSENIDYVNYLLSLTGTNITAGENVTINFTYKRVKDFAEVETVTQNFTISGRYIYNEDYIKDYMYNVFGYDNISDFNAVYTDDYMIDGNIYDTQTRVFLQAESLSYSFDTTSSVGTLNVNYAPFKYSNFVIRITNNDPENNLTIDYFTADVVNNGDSTTLTYKFETIERQIYNSTYWLFDIDQRNFTISSASNVTTSLSDAALTISFNNAYENNLSELSVIVITEIMEDYELEVTFEYVELDDNLEETIIAAGPQKIFYSKMVYLSNENFETLEDTEIIYVSAIMAISPSVLNGQDYYTYDGIRKDYNSDKTACTVVVEYTYTTLLKVTDSLNSQAVYIALNSNSLTYDYEDLPFNVPSGYRIKNVTSDGNIRIDFNEHKPEDLTITVNESTAQKKIITLTAELSDSWYVTVNYLERYKSTPFAVYKTATKEVRVSEYGEIKNITADQTASIIGKSTLNVLKSAVESLDVTYDGKSTYTITPKYTYLSLKAIDYNGNSKEIKVPLTCYEDYCDMFGQDWSILWLNSSKTEYFEYSNSVARDKLYGYFNVAVFEEQVSDLNYFFKSNTGDGCMTIFKSQQVQGSSVYQFASDMKDSLLFGGAGYALMSFCEIANDNNKILESYFFYLDTNSDKPYLSTGGADNAEDEDSAGENLGEDIIGGIKDNVDSIGNEIEDWLNNNPFAQFLKILGYVLIGGLALFLLVWVFRKIK